MTAVARGLETGPGCGLGGGAEIYISSLFLCRHKESSRGKSSLVFMERSYTLSVHSALFQRLQSVSLWDPGSLFACCRGPVDLLFPARGVVIRRLHSVKQRSKEGEEGEGLERL